MKVARKRQVVNNGRSERKTYHDEAQQLRGVRFGMWCSLGKGKGGNWVQVGSAVARATVWIQLVEYRTNIDTSTHYVHADGLGYDL